MSDEPMFRRITAALTTLLILMNWWHELLLVVDTIYTCRRQYKSNMIVHVYIPEIRIYSGYMQWISMWILNKGMFYWMNYILRSLHSGTRLFCPLICKEYWNCHCIFAMADYGICFELYITWLCNLKDNSLPMTKCIMELRYHSSKVWHCEYTVVCGMCYLMLIKLFTFALSDS